MIWWRAVCYERYGVICTVYGLAFRSDLGRDWMGEV